MDFTGRIDCKITANDVLHTRANEKEKKTVCEINIPLVFLCPSRV